MQNSKGFSAKVVQAVKRSYISMVRIELQFPYLKAAQSCIFIKSIGFVYMLDIGEHFHSMIFVCPLKNNSSMRIYRT